MKKLTLKIALVALVLSAATEALAWGGVGHSAIAYAAEQLVEPEVKQKVRAYLGTTITYQASWMDAYRSIKPYTACDDWHSTNIDAKGKVVKGLPTTGAYHIERIRKEMGGGKYKQLPDSLVKINIQYLSHMIGDHHCPVHVRWNKESPPQYFYSLQKKGKKLGYHSFWDGSIGTWRKGWTADKFYAKMQHLTPKQAKKVQKGDGYSWTQQTANTARQCFALTPKGTDIVKLTKEERKAIHAITDRQMQLGAYRLAGVLNEIFGE